MRVEGVGLEHHREAALGRRRVGNVEPVDADFARGDVLKSGNQAEQGRLSTAGRTDEHHEFAITDIEVDRGNDADLAKRLADLLQNDFAHRTSPLYLTAPKVKPRTSWRCENQPRIRIGAIAIVDAAESFAQNKPSGLE